MATHISVTQSVKLSKGSMRHSFDPAPVSLTQTGSLVYDVVSAIGTTEESVGPSFGDIGTEFLCMVQNLDATNYVQLGFSTGVYGMRIYANGVSAVFPLEPNATLYLKANTAACNVRVIVYEK